MKRCAVFIDGFNLYHALKNLNDQSLKWLNLRALSQRLLFSKTESLSSVYYFSAFADWWPEKRDRHKLYVKALENSGVDVVLGHFKKKDRSCRTCNARWVAHEEKETDVNIALYILNESYKDTFDTAYIVSRDSDLKPAIEMLKSEFPDKSVTVVAPPHLGHSIDLLNCADNKRKISLKQLQQCLFPQVLYAADGKELVRRPAKYDP